MRRLRPSLLLRGSEARLTAALVLAAQTLFLWMFLSADPIERLARGDLAVLLFASDWRHGMAGNSWLYMPGFFAVAAAVWLCGRHSPVPAIVTHLSASAAAATFVAAAGSILGARLAADQLLISTGIALGAALPGPSAIGTARGLYTLATWTSFVLACRHALAHRTWRPFIVPAVMSIGLALIRPWMVDDFTSENGAIRVVPGTHKLGKLPQDVLEDPKAPYADEILVTGRAGTVVIMNAHCWHGGTANRTDQPRCAMHSFYCRHDKPQQQWQKQLLRPETQERLTPQLRALLALDDPENDRITSSNTVRSGFLK